MRLNLGSGSLKLEEYENIDRIDGKEAYPLDYPDNSIEEIRASHLLEHFSHTVVFDVVKHWVDKLQLGGVLKIAVPDFRKLVDGYLEKTSDKTCIQLMGSQINENEFHNCIFDESTLRQIMESAGLSDIKHWNDKRDTCRLPISLNLMGTKKEQQTVKRTLRCVISQPRLCFAQNAYSIIKELALRGIEVTVGVGAYWHQVLTNLIEDELEKKPDYLLTLDYDTWFKFEHIQIMMERMEESDVDAIVTNQVKRDNDELLLASENDYITREEYENNLIGIKRGHFGCTLFRASSFEKLKKPWFLPVTGPDQRWRENRVDADIYFWDNFIQSGLKLYWAPKLRIGHLQMMCTFPGEFRNHFEPLHCYMSDVESENIPEFIMKGLKDMKVKVTNKKCGLNVGQEYDLCKMAATGLINSGSADAVETAVPEETVSDIAIKDMKKPQLIDFAAANNIDLGDATLKDDIFDVIQDALAQREY